MKLPKNPQWRSGPPPSVGWWPASICKDPDAIRWWDGEKWSLTAYSYYSSEYAKDMAKRRASDKDQGYIKWTNKWWEPKPAAASEELRPATKEERVLARDQYLDDDIQIDDDAQVSVIEDSENIWVQAWLYVRKQ